MRSTVFYMMQRFDLNINALHIFIFFSANTLYLSYYTINIFVIVQQFYWLDVHIII